MSYNQPPPQYGMQGGSPGQGAAPSNYLVWAILSTIFCCLPLGVASIVFAAQVSSKWAMGDYAGAEDSSRKAKQFALWGTIVGVVFDLLIIVFYAVVLIAAWKSSNNVNS